MAKNQSLISAVLLDGKGGGKTIGWDEIAQWTPDQGILWVHLNYSTAQAQKWLSQSSKLDKVIWHAMVAEESRPRSLINHDGILVFLRGVNLNPGQEPQDMVSVRIWIDQHRIISVRKRRILSVNDLHQTIEENRGPKSPSEFLTMLNDRLINRMADVIEDVGDQIDELEEEVVSAESHLLRPKLADIRRQSIMIRRYLAPQREALNRLYMEESALLSQVDRVSIRESTDRVIRYIEDLDAVRDRATVTQEELASRLAEQMDRRIYLLSVVAVIFLPLTFITGLLGINVSGIPGASYRWGFLIVCLVLLSIVLLMLWVFHHKKWI